MSRKHRHKNRVRKKDIDYHFYNGVPHSHTEYSTGKGSPEEALAHARSTGINFLIITDHNKYLDDIIKYKKDKIQKWNALDRIIRHFNKKSRSTLGVRGYEIKIKSIGDLNIINSSKRLKGMCKDLKKLYLYLEDEEKCVGIINHPGASAEKLKYHAELNEYVRLIEVGNGSPPHKYNRYFRCLYRLLDCGWKLGVVNGQDNHSDNWGDSDNLTVLLAKELTIDSILDALKNRRTYSAESRTLKLLYKVNEANMGEVFSIKTGSDLRFSILAEDNRCEIERIEIITNGGRIIKDIQAEGNNKIIQEFLIKASPDEKWYAVKIFQKNNRISISSPVFIETI